MTELSLYPNWSGLDLEHRNLLDPILRSLSLRSSEFTFTNLFIWRKHYGFTICRMGETILVRAEPGEEPPFLMPPLGPSLKPEELRRLVEDMGPGGSIARADRIWLDRNPGLETVFRITPERDQFDYLYRTQDLIHLSGRKYHKKKNHLNRFRKSYDFTYRTLTPDMIGDCLKLSEEWCILRNCDEYPSLQGEEQAIKEALEHWDDLEFQGGALFVEGRLEAFALGELLNPDTAVIHIEKADFDIQGVYAAINQQFAEHAWSHTTYINREQDLGEPNLRRAKESYFPCDMIEKFRLEPM